MIRACYNIARRCGQLLFRFRFLSSQAGGGYPPINLIGQRFHRLTVIERRENSRNRQARAFWRSAILSRKRMLEG
jgi:hypothetical protein